MPGLFVPQGELETLGIGKETTFGTLATPTIWHCFKSFQPKTTVDAIARAPRASIAQPAPGTGGRSVSMTLDVEPDPDTFPQLLAYTLGSQTGPATTLYSSTLNGAVTAGNTSITVASSLFCYTGESISIGGTTPETVVISQVNGANIKLKTALANNHANNATVTATGGTGGGGGGGKLITMTMGSPLPSFSLEVARPGATSTDYLGSCVDQLTLSCAAKQGLQAKFSLLAQNDVTQGSPTTAALSVLNPYIFEQQFTFAQMGGEVLGGGTAASLLSFQLTINNNLNKNYWTFGSGNIVRSFPEQQRKVSGTVTLGFESSTQLTNFNSAQSGGNNTLYSMIIPLVATDLTSVTNPMAMGIYMPKIFLQTMDIQDDTSKALQVTYSFSCGESDVANEATGPNDNITIYSINSASAQY